MGKHNRNSRYENSDNNEETVVDEEVIEETSEEVEEETITEEPKAKEVITAEEEPVEEPVEEAPTEEELVIEDAVVPSDDHLDFGDIQKQIEELDEKRRESRSAIEKAVLADQIKNLNRMKPEQQSTPVQPIISSNAPKRVVTGSVRTGRTTMVNL